MSFFMGIPRGDETSSTRIADSESNPDRTSDWPSNPVLLSCGPRTSGYSIIWELVRNTDSLAHPRPSESQTRRWGPEIWVLTSPVGHPYARSSVSTTVVTVFSCPLFSMSCSLPCTLGQKTQDALSPMTLPVCLALCQTLRELQSGCQVTPQPSFVVQIYFLLNVIFHPLKIFCFCLSLLCLAFPYPGMLQRPNMNPYRSMVST